MSFRQNILSGAAAALLLTLTASAEMIRFDSVSGTLSDAVPSGGIYTTIYSDSGSEARWGNNPRPDRSGVRFNGAAPPSFLESSGSGPFSIGEITHFNNPVDDPIDEIRLLIMFSGAIVGGDAFVRSISYLLGIDETSNSNACNAGILGCAAADSDTVTLTLLGPPAGAIEGLTFIGFSKDGGSTITPSLNSQEWTNTKANLFMQFDVTQQTVPEPSTWAMLLTGVLAIASRRLIGRRA